MMNDNVSLIKKSGERIDNIQASVQAKKIFIDRSDILIETGDLIQRKMSNGGEDTYKVIDPGFHEKFGDIPAGYQMTHKKLGLPEAKRAIQNITVTIHGDNSGNMQVGNDNAMNISEFNQKFTQLIQEIENSSIGNKAEIIQELNKKKEDKTALQSSLGILLTRGAEVATLMPAIGALLSILG
ncbi:MAG: hypothetical protein LGB05_08430 [Sulfurovum sp.]|nr:hypothetical protein [Sulfurovum sp.]MCB4773628.1 hypothetical protein [Sulfurovum sp.]